MVLLWILKKCVILTNRDYEIEIYNINVHRIGGM